MIPGFGYLDLEKKLHYRSLSQTSNLCQWAPFLLLMNKLLFTPIPVGSVGISSAKLLAMVDCLKDNPCLLQVGDKVKFAPFTKQKTFRTLIAMLEAQTWDLKFPIKAFLVQSHCWQI